MEPNNKMKPAPRIPLFIDVEFRKSYARTPQKGVLKNISISGAFLENPEEFGNRDKILITFEVSGRMRKIQASVVWTCTNGAGIKFLPFNNRDVQIVDDLMYFVESNRESRRDVLDSIFSKVG